jgi:hypothetical protein
MYRRLFNPLPRLVAAVLVALVSALPLVAPSRAHFDPPGQPIRVQVRATGVAPNQDEDDGPDGNAELSITYFVNHRGHQTEKGRTVLTTDYDWDERQRKLQPVDALLYEHLECSPMNEVKVFLRLWEDDALGDADFLGAGEHTFAKPGERTVLTGGRGDQRRGRVRIEVTATPLSAEEAALAECVIG